MQNRNINDDLDKLIILYGLDRFHPRYAKAVRARQLMKEWFAFYESKQFTLVAASLTDAYYVQEDCDIKNPGGGYFAV